MNKFNILWGVAVVATLLSFSALADEATAPTGHVGDFQLRVRAIGVIPDEDSVVSIGGEANVNNAFVPEVDLTWFPTQNIGLELIAATARHSLKYNDTTKLGDTWILPPTLTVQYHPLRGESNFSPYVGAGLNYSWFYGEDSAAGTHNLDVEGGVGYALQAGADYWLNDRWGVNLDVKKLWLDVDANVNVGATPVHADVDLDPWIIGAGISYRF